MSDRQVLLQGLNWLPSESMLTKEEALFLYNIAEKFRRPITWVELGVWCGRGLWSAGMGLPDRSTLAGVDDFSGLLPVKEGSDKLIKAIPSGMQEALVEAVGVSLQHQRDIALHVVKGRTHEVAEWYTPIIDVLVVDASHDYASVKQDLADWLPKVVPGGLVICHDFTAKYPGVMQAVQECGRRYETVPQTRYCKFLV